MASRCCSSPGATRSAACAVAEDAIVLVKARVNKRDDPVWLIANEVAALDLTEPVRGPVVLRMASKRCIPLGRSPRTSLAGTPRQDRGASLPDGQVRSPTSSWPTGHPNVGADGGPEGAGGVGLGVRLTPGRPPQPLLGAARRATASISSANRPNSAAGRSWPMPANATSSHRGWHARSPARRDRLTSGSAAPWSTSAGRRTRPQRRGSVPGGGDGHGCRATPTGSRQRSNATGSAGRASRARRSVPREPMTRTIRTVRFDASCPGVRAGGDSSAVSRLLGRPPRPTCRRWST